MKTIHIAFSNERLITPNVLVFVGQILGKSSFAKKINQAPISSEYLQKQITNGDVLLTYIGMLCQGKPQYEAVREMMDDPDYYKYALGILILLTCPFNRVRIFLGHITPPHLAGLYADAIPVVLHRYRFFPEPCPISESSGTRQGSGINDAVDYFMPQSLSSFPDI